MKKSKLLMLSGFVAGATTLGSVATLVSCGDKKPTTDEQLSIAEESKHVTIEDGNVEHTFIFISTKKITKEDNITAIAVYVDETKHDFDVSFFINPEETAGTNEVKVHATLSKDGTYNIPSGSYTKLSVHFTLTDGKEQTIEGFDFDFKTVEGALTVSSNSILTMPKSTFAKIEFNLNKPFPEDGEIYAEILDEECSRDTLNLELDDYTREKYWELSEDQTRLIIWFELQNASVDSNDKANFNLLLRCTSKSSPSNTSVYWEQKFEGSAGSKAFTIFYTDANFGMDPNDMEDSPLNHNAGDNQKKFNLYYYKGFTTGTPWITLDISGVDAQIEYGDVFETTSYRALPITITFTDPSGQNLQDQDITFKIVAHYDGGIQEITQDIDGVKFCYRNKKLSEQFNHPSRFTQPGQHENIEFDEGALSLLSGSSEGLTYKYEIINDDEHSKNAKAVGLGESSIGEGQTKFPFLVTINPTSGTLTDGDYATFDVKVICYKDDEVQWMQQTSGNGGGVFTATYHESIVWPSLDVSTDWEGNTAEFAFTYNPNNMEIDDSSFSWTTDHSVGVETITDPTFESDSGQGTIVFQLKASEGDEIPFNSYLDGNIAFSATAPKWPNATSEEQYRMGFTHSGITVNYKGIIQYQGPKDIVTQPGQNRAELQFDMNPEAAALIGTNLEVEAIYPESNFRWNVDKDGIVFDDESNILTVPVFGENKDGSVIVGGQHCTNMGLKFTFTIDGKKYEKQFTGFSYSYTSLIDDGAVKSLTTEPGLRYAQYTVHSRIAIPGIQDDQLKVEYAGTHAMFLDEIPVDVHLDEKSENKNIIFEVRAIDEITEDIKYSFDIIIEDEYLGIKERVTGFDFTYTGNKVTYLGTEGQSLDRVFELPISSTDETTTIESPLLRFKVDGYEQSLSSEFRFEIEQTVGQSIVSIVGGDIGYDSPSIATFKVVFGGKQALTPSQHQAFSVKVTRTQDGEEVWSQTIHGFGIVVSPESKAEELTAATKTTVMTDYSGSTQDALKVFEDGKPTLPKGTKAGKHYQITVNRADWVSQCTGLPIWNKATWKLGTYENPTQSHVPYLHYSGVKVYVMFKGTLIPLIQTDYSHKEDGDWYQSTGGPISVFNESLERQYSTEWTSLVFDLYLADDVTVADTDFYITLADR